MCVSVVPALLVGMSPHCRVDGADSMGERLEEEDLRDEVRELCPSPVSPLVSSVSWLTLPFILKAGNSSSSTPITMLPLSDTAPLPGSSSISIAMSMFAPVPPKLGSSGPLEIENSSSPGPLGSWNREKESRS